MAPQNAAQDKEKVRRRPGRVPTACAECRRLKLRCDRKVPCETCTKRGCAAICPDGALAAGKGNRLVLANTEELHEKIERLCYRIRELEDAVRILQAKVSDEPHPLLMNDLLQLKDPMSVDQAAPTRGSPSQNDPPAADQEDDSFVDAFGTLSIGPTGETTFLGKTARSEYLINAPLKTTSTSKITFPRLSQRILTALVPISETGIVDDELGRDVFAMLPPLSEAIQMCELYLEYGKYLWSPVPRKELFDECLMVVYRAESFDNFKAYHSLSLLFTVFALAALYDPARPPFSVDAEEYYVLSRLAFNFAPIDATPMSTKLSSVQAMCHMAHYLELSDSELKGSSKSWIHIGTAVRLGHMIGLHLNSARWGLDKVTSDRRSRVFWELFLVDTWLSFGFGRPPNLSPAYIDCALPEDVDQVTNKDGKLEMGYHHWSWNFTMLMHNIIATAFGPKMPTYSTILALDRKLRDFPVPLYLRPVCNDETAASDLTMKRWFVLGCKETILLNLHRSYFAQALQDQPHDLLKHKYGPSVIATYRSAWRLIEGLRMPAKQTPHIIGRVTLAWSQTLSAAVVMCLLVTRAPTSSLTTSSLEELDRAAALFEEAAVTCPPAAHHLEVVRKLRQKAHEAVDHSPPQDPHCLTPGELDRLGGRTHLISETNDPHLCSTSVPVPTPLPREEPSYQHTPQPSMFGHESIDNIHSTILQDMRIFDGFDMSNSNDLFDFPPDSFPQGSNNLQFSDIDIFNPPAMGQFQMVNQPPPPVAPSFNGVPYLDATWHGFMEQLGF